MSELDPVLRFTPEELELIGRTADAMTAYMGKPVLAEVIDGEETGFEWVIFGVPLDINDNPEDESRVQIGGAGSRMLGNNGGMKQENEAYDCQFMWAIQLSDLEGVRFIKVDSEGDEVAWSDTLESILPFDVLNEPEVAPDDDDHPDTGEDPPLVNGPGNHTVH
jgi:hypothetical protein